MTMNLSQCIDRNRLGIIGGTVAIGFAALCFGSTYLTVNVCSGDDDIFDRQYWLCEWMSIGVHGQNASLSMNRIFLSICLSVIFIGHEAFVSSLSSSIFRECRRNNTPNAAYPLWSIIGTAANFSGPLTAGMLWVFCGQTDSMLIILPFMCMLDVVALCILIYLTHRSKQR